MQSADNTVARPKVSVALAAKNGQQFLAEQLYSIAPQLRPGDELVISVDPSNDATLAIIDEAMQTYNGDDALSSGTLKFIVLGGPGAGIVANFQHALQACSGEIIFLADQDDVWQEDKVSTVLEAFAVSPVLLICHDAVVVNEQLELLEPSYFAWHKSRRGFMRNFIRNSYVGCCLALRKELLATALPFPPNIPMHDQWLGLMAEQQNSSLLLNEPLLLYRRHGTTASKNRHARISQMFRWRLALCKALVAKR